MHLHVDDMLVAGDPDSEFADKKKRLQKAFHLGKWNQSSITYCGGQVSENKKHVELSFHEYVKKMRPIQVAEGNRKCNAHEITQLRGLIGSLQWPAGQACPQLACSISMLAGLVPKADLDTLKSANKT